MFAEILGLAGSAIGAIGSMTAADKAQKTAIYQAQVQEAARQQQQQFNNYLLGLSQDFYRDQNRRYDQGLSYFDTDRSTRANESQFSRSLLAQDRFQKQSEYSNVLDRQLQLDRDAARNRAFQLEQYLRAQNISAAERAQAMSELKNAQAIASGERDDELKRFYEDRQTRSTERQFQIDELRRAQQIAEENRRMAYDQRSKYDAATGDLRDATRQTIQNLGNIREIPELTSADIMAEEGRRRGLYERAIDRAAGFASSQNEAALIRGGVDASSTGAHRRAEVAEKIAPLYEQAYQRAADDALKYMGGVQSTLFANYDKDLARRAAVINEARLPISQYLESVMRAPQIAGELGIGPSFANVGSSIYDKRLTSANDYRAPMQVNSAFLPANLNLVGSDYGQNIMTQASGLGPRDFQSGILGGMNQYVTQIQSPLSGISNLSWGYDTASRNAIDARNYAYGRNQDMGKSFADLSGKVGNALDNFDWKGTFGSGFNGSSADYSYGAGGYTGAGPFM